MGSRRAKLAWLAAAAACVLGIGVVPPAHATDGGFGAPTVVLDNLAHPRGIKALKDGVVLVTESGREGVGPCITVFAGRPPQCFSSTGMVSVVLGSHKYPLVSDLASVGTQDGASVTGPSDVVLGSQGLVIVMGLGTNPTQRDDLGEAALPLAQLVRLSSSGPVPFADLADYEEANNPDNLPGFSGLWAHPFSVTADGDSYLVADSGANTVYRVSSSGAISTLAVIPSQVINGATVQSVPSAVLKARDGSYLVSEFTGYPYTGKVARIWRVVPGQPLEIVAQGLDPILDMDFDNHGRLHVLEVEFRGSPAANPAGRVTRIDSDGTAVPVVTTGLTMPTAMSFTPTGELYVVNTGVSLNGGRLVRYGRTG